MSNYPHPFVNVVDLGYARVMLNAAFVAGLFLALAVGAHALRSEAAGRRVPVLRPVGREALPHLAHRGVSLSQ